jgi:hypothetical protein
MDTKQMMIDISCLQSISEAMTNDTEYFLNAIRQQKTPLLEK